jgi:hypothetical protein
VTRIELIAEDVERLRAAYPELDDVGLGEALATAALRHRHDAWDHEDTYERFVHEAAALATYRHRLIGAARAGAAARERERDAYDANIELDKDIIPPLKIEARRSRAEIRRLESALLAQGIDPTTIEPIVEGPKLAVDDYEAPRFVDETERRRDVVAFFRRVGGDRG